MKDKQKTPITELIDNFNTVLRLIDKPNSELDLKHCVKTFKKKAIELLQKEKEAFIEFGNSCALKQLIHDEMIDKMSKDELLAYSKKDIETVGEETFNETFL